MKPLVWIMLNRCCTGFQMLKHICMVQYVCTLLPETVHSAYMFLFELEGFGCWSVKEVVVTSLGSALRCYRVLISRGQRRLAKLLVSRVFSWIWIPTCTELTDILHVFIQFHDIRFIYRVPFGWFSSWLKQSVQLKQCKWVVHCHDT